MKLLLQLKRISALAIAISFNSICAQTQPFPANLTFSNGLMATNKSDVDATASYDIWKTNFIESCSNGRYRVKFDNPSETVSEGIGYGMLLTVYKADKVTFDGLWNYYKDNRNSNGVMNWKISGCSGAIGQNGATDAELDVAMALIVADYQWGSTGTINYRGDAEILIAAIKAHEVEANTYVLKPGDMFGGSSLTNPSYFAPAYYRAYGAFTNDSAFWNAVAAKSYTVINANLTQNNAVGGLVSDWCQSSGAYSNEAGGYANGGQKYTYDAARTPWRIVVDYVWFGDNTGKVYAKKCSDFVRVNLGGTANIKDGYNQDGTLAGQWHNATFVGAFACAAMAGEDQTHLDASYTDLKNLNEPNSYFNHTLKTIYQFLLTGNFYLPPNATLSNDTFAANGLEVSVYPNPSNGSFIVAAPIASSICVVDVHGKVILEKNTSDLSSTIDMNAQAPGLYLVKIVNEDKQAFRKIVIN
ncbi:T9SS type A sorting domain-containing protein [Flavobacterium jejuense]|uniref:cellulase n=1 Tax=Flavobacterium jejuense TaxID=1544455 RepID=A0ABX0IV74_9FLAO|nr:glycosyl hydrolase family 8 [Flavobacterium jejuense]NHN27076.1 T9SS type A sorting domain-containing protein [Flavobacterium jejuense]